jgi:hypothetical protein
MLFINELRKITIRNAFDSYFHFFWNDLRLFKRKKLIIHARLGVYCRSILFNHRNPHSPLVCVCVCVCVVRTHYTCDAFVY